MSSKSSSSGLKLNKVDYYQLNITELHSFDDKLGLIKKSSDKIISDFEKLKMNDKVVMKTTKSNEQIIKITSNKSEILIDNLKPFTMYQIDVMSVNEHGTSLKSNPIRIVTHSTRSKSDKQLVPVKSKPIKLFYH